MPCTVSALRAVTPMHVCVVVSQVGLIGYHTLDTAFQTGIGKVRFNDIVPSMVRCVSDFQVAHPDVTILIALTHAGEQGTAGREGGGTTVGPK